MSDADIALAIPLDGMALIEASAGTGKTYTLAGLYLRLIIERRLSARHIAVVTFTTAATQELKRRLRARLSVCLQLLDAQHRGRSESTESTEAAQALRLIDAATAAEQPVDLQRRLKLALLDLDSAPIATIHGYCRRALADHGALAGRILRGELVASDHDLIDAIAGDLWREAASNPDPVDFDGLRALTKSASKFSSLLRELISGDRELTPPAPACPETVEQRGLSVLHGFIHRASERLAAIKRNTGRYSHDDEIRGLFDALSGTQGDALADRLYADYPAALIDEFQDTDARQFAIFERIYRERGSLILIGDPKQAIYGFRGGDVHTYLAARELAGRPLSLARNFRSTPRYLDALNALYRFAGDRGFAVRGIDYQAVQPGGRAADDDLLIDGQPATALTIWHAAEPISSKDDARERLAAACASGIVDLLAPGRSRLRQKATDEIGYDALAPSDIAVLVATHDEAFAISQALSARGVASASTIRRSVFATDEALELHAVLDALSELDEAKLRGMLATVLFGASASELAALADDSAGWSRQLAKLAELRALWLERGVLAMLERVLASCARRLLALERGERRLTNWLQLAELAQTAAPARSGLRGLVDWLAVRMREADDHREDEQLRLESDANRVHIYTLHKSKGLEFPVVFLPFAGLRRGMQPSYPMLCAYRGADAQARVWLGGSKEAFAEGEGAIARNAAQADALAERLRVLYVGLTRATCASFVAAGVFGSQSHGDAAALMHLLGVGSGKTANAILAESLRKIAVEARGAIAVVPLPREGSGHLSPLTRETFAPARRLQRRPRDRWRMHSYSQLALGDRGEPRPSGEDEIPAVIAAPADSPERIDDGLRGARFGTTFHDILEHVDFAAWRDWPGTDAPPGQDAIVDAALARHGYAANATVRVPFHALIARTLNTPLPFGARLADLAPAEYRAEMPFHFAVGDADAQAWLARLHAAGYLTGRTRFALDDQRLDGIMTGVLDLVVFRAGRWWVIDYKTNVLEGTGTESSFADYAPEHLQRAVRDSEYDLQYLIYLTALHRWLKSSLGTRYDYARDVGGALYLFVRGLDAAGNGIHVDAPPAELIDSLDRLLAAPSAQAA